MVSYGPFFMGGKAKKGSKETSSQVHSDSQGIAVDGLQCIGFKCHMLPKSPNPDPAITSWV
jgi:hypothetical protein